MIEVVNISEIIELLTRISPPESVTKDFLHSMKLELPKGFRPSWDDFSSLRFDVLARSYDEFLLVRDEYHEMRWQQILKGLKTAFDDQISKTVFPDKELLSNHYLSKTVKSILSLETTDHWYILLEDIFGKRIFNEEKLWVSRFEKVISGPRRKWTKHDFRLAVEDQLALDIAEGYYAKTLSSSDHSAIARVLETITAREKTVLISYYGLYGRRWTVKEYSAACLQIKFSTTAIYNVLNRAKRKLRHPSRSKSIRRLLEPLNERYLEAETDHRSLLNIL